MYYIKLWDTDETVETTTNLVHAKKIARGQGHAGDTGHPTQFLPLAYVANERGECVYNPRFSKLISGAVGSVINAQPSTSF